MADVIFIGAGPIGLYAAIQTKLHCPDQEVVIYEKYREYQRKHVLIIDPSSYKEAHSDQQFQTILQRLTGKVPTSEIESQLLSYAQQLGIEIRYQKIDSTDALREEHPECNVFIGADGSHSLVRQQQFNDEKIVEADLQYIVEMKYHVSGQAKPLSTLAEYLPALSLANHLTTEFIGKLQSDGTTPISLRFFVDKQTFDDFKAANVSFKHPLNIETAKSSESASIRNVAASVEKWQVARKGLHNDVIVEGSDKITAINLPVYRSTYFHKQFDHLHWCLVGDAAMGVPYFRALNAGLIGANQLAKSLAQHFKPEPLAFEEPTVCISSFSKISRSLEPLPPFSAYASFMNRLAQREIFNARLKASSIAVADTSVCTMQTLPVSASKLPADVKRDMKAVDAAEKTSFQCAIM
jgi:hypothetical protein